MTLTDLLERRRLRRHKTSAQEIANLLATAERDLADARVEAVSLDRRFMAAYGAALALATVPLTCAGYRTTGEGRHMTVFEALPVTMGEDYEDLSTYYDSCRRKRHTAGYRRPGEVSESEVEELIESVSGFMDQVKDWLPTNHPELLRE